MLLLLGTFFLKFEWRISLLVYLGAIIVKYGVLLILPHQFYGKSKGMIIASILIGLVAAFSPLLIKQAEGEEDCEQDGPKQDQFARAMKSGARPAILAASLYLLSICFVYGSNLAVAPISLIWFGLMCFAIVAGVVGWFSLKGNSILQRAFPIAATGVIIALFISESLIRSPHGGQVTAGLFMLTMILLLVIVPFPLVEEGSAKDEKKAQLFIAAGINVFVTATVLIFSAVSVYVKPELLSIMN
ncbi:MAG: hypothetical protein ACK4P3_06535 [Fimbriimonadaceae bacterium]